MMENAAESQNSGQSKTVPLDFDDALVIDYNTLSAGAKRSVRVSIEANLATSPTNLEFSIDVKDQSYSEIVIDSSKLDNGDHLNSFESKKSLNNHGEGLSLPKGKEEKKDGKTVAIDSEINGLQAEEKETETFAKIAESIMECELSKMSERLMQEKRSCEVLQEVERLKPTQDGKGKNNNCKVRLAGREDSKLNNGALLSEGCDSSDSDRGTVLKLLSSKDDTFQVQANSKPDPKDLQIVSEVIDAICDNGLPPAEHSKLVDIESFDKNEGGDKRDFTVSNENDNACNDVNAVYTSLTQGTSKPDPKDGEEFIERDSLEAASEKECDRIINANLKTSAIDELLDRFLGSAEPTKLADDEDDEMQSLDKKEDDDKIDFTVSNENYTWNDGAKNSYGDVDPSLTHVSSAIDADNSEDIIEAGGSEPPHCDSEEVADRSIGETLETPDAIGELFDGHVASAKLPILPDENDNEVQSADRNDGDERDLTFCNENDDRFKPLSSNDCSGVENLSQEQVISMMAPDGSDEIIYGDGSKRSHRDPEEIDQKTFSKCSKCLEKIEEFSDIHLASTGSSKSPSGKCDDVQLIDRKGDIKKSDFLVYNNVVSKSEHSEEQLECDTSSNQELSNADEVGKDLVGRKMTSEQLKKTNSIVASEGQNTSKRKLKESSRSDIIQPHKISKRNVKKESNEAKCLAEDDSEAGDSSIVEEGLTGDDPKIVATEILDEIIANVIRNSDRDVIIQDILCEIIDTATGRKEFKQVEGGSVSRPPKVAAPQRRIVCGQDVVRAIKTELADPTFIIKEEPSDLTTEDRKPVVPFPIVLNNGRPRRSAGIICREKIRPPRKELAVKGVPMTPGTVVKKEPLSSRTKNVNRYPKRRKNDEPSSVPNVVSKSLREQKIIYSTPVVPSTRKEANSLKNESSWLRPRVKKAAVRSAKGARNTSTKVECRKRTVTQPVTVAAKRLKTSVSPSLAAGRKLSAFPVKREIKRNFAVKSTTPRLEVKRNIALKCTNLRNEIRNNIAVISTSRMEIKRNIAVRTTSPQKNMKRNVAVKSTGSRRRAQVARKSGMQTVDEEEIGPYFRTRKRRQSSPGDPPAKRPADIFIPMCFVKLIRMPAIARLLEKPLETDISICDLCQPKRVFVSKEGLVYHLREQHRDVFITPSAASDGETKKNRCTGCDRSFQARSRLEQHLRICPSVVGLSSMGKISIPPSAKKTKKTFFKRGRRHRRVLLDKINTLETVEEAPLTSRVLLDKINTLETVEEAPLTSQDNSDQDPLNLDSETTVVPSNDQPSHFASEMVGRSGKLILKLWREKAIFCCLKCSAVFHNKESLREHEDFHNTGIERHQLRHKKETSSPEMKIIDGNFPPAIKKMTAQICTVTRPISTNGRGRTPSTRKTRR